MLDGKVSVSGKVVVIGGGLVGLEVAEYVEEVSCDYVVVAIGARSRGFNHISSYCEQKNINYHIIGDAVRARRALNATAEAAEIARENNPSTLIY